MSLVTFLPVLVVHRCLDTLVFKSSCTRGVYALDIRTAMKEKLGIYDGIGFRFVRLNFFRHKAVHD